MAKKLTITPGVDFPGNAQIASINDLVTWFTQSTFGDVDRDHFASGTTPIVVSSVAPTAAVTGLGWFDTSTGQISFYNGTAWIGSVTYADDAPDSTGNLWYDTSLDVLRRYELRGSITGWHAVSPDYALMHNRSGVTVAANLVVVQSNEGTSTQEFTTGTTIKDPGVLGVLLEATDNDLFGLVALASGSAVVDVKADVASTDGTIAKGHYLSHFSEIGECRTSGPKATVAYNADGSRVTGVPLGAFAEALGAKDGTTHLVSARMLGGVGQGATVTKVKVSFVTTTTTDGDEGDWEEIDFGTAVSAMHKPVAMVNALLTLEASDGGNNHQTASVDLSIDADAVDSGTVLVSYKFDRNMSGTASFYSGGTINIPTVNDSSGTDTATDLGQKISARVDLTGAGTGVDAIAHFDLIGYVY
jgi:hypothetical protein